MIPDSIVGSRGIEYWVDVVTLNSRLTDPAASPSRRPRTLSVTLLDLAEPAVHPADLYRMVSVPLVFESNVTLDKLLQDQTAFGIYDPTQWRSWRWVPILGRYVELSQAGEESHFHPEPGRGFWLISRSRNQIRTSPIQGESTPTGAPYAIALAPGWNQIGQPFNFTVAWDSVMVDTLTMAGALAAGDVIEAPWRRGPAGYRQDVAALQPFEGYWVSNITEPAREVVLKVPPVESGASMVLTPQEPSPHDGARGEEGLEAGVSDGEWRILITAACAGASDPANTIGVGYNAREVWDPFDQSEPPMSPGEGLSLYFPHAGWEIRPGLYTTDIRPGSAPSCPGLVQGANSQVTSQGEGYIWRFDVSKNFSSENGGDEVTVTFEGAEAAPSEYQALLIDHNLLKTIDLRSERAYRFFLGERALLQDEEAARFAILVGDAAFIQQNWELLPDPPSRTELFQNYPNPFNPSTVIRYDLALPGPVSLRIYDARGVLVKTLENSSKPAGRYEAGWNGLNEAGERVASGVYFYRLATPGFTQTRKMILIK